MRQRPLRERRGLAVTAYIAIASLIAVVWAASFRQSLNIASVDSKSAGINAGNSGAENGLSGSEFKKDPPSAANPETPLQTLRTAMTAMVAGVKEFNHAIGGLKKNLDFAAGIPPPTQFLNQSTGNDEPGAETKKEASGPEPKADAPPNAGRVIALAPGAKKEADAGREPSPAEIVSMDLGEKAYSYLALAKLSLPSPEFARIRIKNLKEQNRFVKIVYYNLGEIRKTAVDFYKYLTQ